MLEAAAKFKLALMGTAVQSTRRGMEWEHRMIEGGLNPDELDGGQIGTVDMSADGEMGPLILGDFNAPSTQQSSSTAAGGWLAPLIGAAAGAGLLGTGLGLASMFMTAEKPVVGDGTTTTSVERTVKEYEIRFFDAEGNPVEGPAPLTEETAGEE